MIVETHDALQAPQIVEATVVVIRDRFQQPLVIVVETPSGQPVYACARDANFADICKQYGIDQSYLLVTQSIRTYRDGDIPQFERP